MTADDYSTVLANALQRLETLKGHVQATQIEQDRKECLLRELEARLEELREEKEKLSQRTRELNADTTLIVNELRVYEELEMLDCMLSEKNTQLMKKQTQHEALLQQLANMETELGASRRYKEISQEDYYHDDNNNNNNNNNNDGNDSSSSASHWKYCCNYLLSHVEGINRYSLLQPSHLGSHPVSVFHQSVRKMYRTAREREEELAIQFKYVDKQLEEVLSLDNTLGAIERDYRHEEKRLERENQETIQTMKKVAAVETKKLRKELQKVVDDHQDLMEGLRAQGIHHVDGELLSSSLADIADMISSTSGDQVNISQIDDANIDSVNAYKSDLKSVVVIQPSHPRKKVLEFNGIISTSAFTPLSPIGDDNTNIHTPNEVNRKIVPYAYSSPTIIDPEIEELQSQVAAAERSAHRLEQGYETLKEETSRSLCEEDAKIEAMEARLAAAQDALEMLKKEKAEWEALHKQMSSLLS
ncbi:uncharacterized protein TM35_000034490 [Trypanosoma theileri]|uniref:Uncharacterized protein n=1 Tax=Trypanosoma theileri TaxID=67003 RepID=A0A1X0P6X7_9TRYP|nr:uncharacterized protein TM35_000034490 [Trypanosoma theileri]ORC92696.1 hypothetical protein TM35_000034490 [Trypanosoma theileri]